MFRREQSYAEDQWDLLYAEDAKERWAVLYVSTRGQWYAVGGLLYVFHLHQWYDGKDQLGLLYVF